MVLLCTHTRPPARAASSRVASLGGHASVELWPDAPQGMDEIRAEHAKVVHEYQHVEHLYQLSSNQSRVMPLLPDLFSSQYYKDLLSSFESRISLYADGCCYSAVPRHSRLPYCDPPTASIARQSKSGVQLVVAVVLLCGPCNPCSLCFHASMRAFMRAWIHHAARQVRGASRHSK